MPELPEAETVARTIYPHVINCRITAFSLLRQATLHELSLPLRSVVGQCIGNVRRRGKLILMDLARSQDAKVSDMLVFHLRMTGRLFTGAANKEQGRHTRCVFELEKPDGSPLQLFFDDMRTFGQIMATNPLKIEAWPFWRDLGPEPLEIGVTDFAPRLIGSRNIKAALLDQKVIAGIGNIYADESLFHAGIHPERAAGSLSSEEIGKLLGAIKKVLRASISQCGSSIRDYRDADGKSGSFQNSFSVYGRGGRECRACGATLVKTRLGGRSTVYCPNCQK